MRRGLLLVPLLLLPGAAATSPTPAYEFDAAFDKPPRAGETGLLRVRLHANLPLDATLRLEVPAWVRVEEDPEWRARAAEGETIERAWHVSPRQPGFWRATLSMDPQEAREYREPVDPSAERQAVFGCCLFVWSGEAGALASARAEEAIPPAEANVTLLFRALDAGRAEMVVRLEPTSAWLRHESFMVQFLGTGDLPPERAPADGPATFTRAFPLAHNGSAVVTASASAWVTFETPLAEDVGRGSDLGCWNVQVERVGDDVREASRWSCYAAATRSFVPAPPLALLLAAALLVARSAYPRGAA